MMAREQKVTRWVVGCMIMSLLFLSGGVAAPTDVCYLDDYTMQTNNAVFTNASFTYMNVSEYMESAGPSGLCGYRKSVSWGNEGGTICASGCTFTTAQDAMCSIPKEVRHEIAFICYDGACDEHVWVPPFKTMDIINAVAVEGSAGGVVFQGNASNPVAVRLKSLHGTNIQGVTALRVRYFNITNETTWDDENAAMIFYKSESVLINNVTFDNNNTGVVAYESTLRLEDLTFSGRNTNCVVVKNPGRVFSQDADTWSGSCRNIGFYTWGGGKISLKDEPGITGNPLYNADWGTIELHWLDVTLPVYSADGAINIVPKAASNVRGLNITQAGDNYGIYVTATKNSGSTYTGRFALTSECTANVIDFHRGSTQKAMWIYRDCTDGQASDSVVEIETGSSESHALIELTAGNAAADAIRVSGGKTLLKDTNVTGTLRYASVPGGSMGCALKWNSTTGVVYC